MKIGNSLASKLEDELSSFLESNVDIFAWTPIDISVIDSQVVTHQLNIDLESRPIRQQKWKFHIEKNEAIKQHIATLKMVGVIREVEYLSWLSNVVLVKKACGASCMCVAFTDLNKACPKDCFPLPSINQLVYASSGFGLMSFLDTYSRYHQIKMHPNDEEKASFITEEGTFCYIRMPFGLKNTGATYQRLVNKMFKGQLGRNLEANIDDMVVKSAQPLDHIRDL